MNQVAANEVPEVARTVVSTRAGFAVVRLEGEHDMATKQELSEVLTRQLQQRELVVVDLSETAFIDSSAIGALVKAQKDAEAVGRQLRLQLAEDGIVRRVIEISGLLDTFTCLTSRAEALNGHAPKGG